MKKYCIFAIIATVLLTLSSCTGETSISLFEDGHADVVIVQSSENDIESNAAAVLYNFVREAMGSRDIDMVADSKDEDPDRVEIIVGDTEREQSQTVRKSLRHDEYAIRLIDGKIVIVGGSSESTAAAVDHFKANYADILASGIFSAEDNYTHTIDYAIKEATIAGNLLGEYVIVYPANEGTYSEKPSVMKYAADRLHDYFIEMCGISLDVVTDIEEEAKYEILVGATNRTESGKYYTDGERETYDFDLCVEGCKLVFAPGGLLAAEAIIDLIDAFVGDNSFEIPAKTSLSDSVSIEAREEEFVYVTDDGIKGESPIGSFTLGGTDISKFVIVCRDNTDADSTAESDTYAAEQLAKYIEYATGVKLDVVYDTEPEQKYEIIVGDTDRADPVDREGLGVEGFEIRSEGSKLYICGGPTRGALYGVYEFLKEYVGCRFFASDCEVIYKAESLDVPANLCDRQVSDLEYRDIYSYDSLWGDIASKLKINGYYQRSFMKKEGGSFEFAGGSSAFVHTFSKLFGMGSMTTQPCLSDPENLEHAIKIVRGYLNAYPYCKVISVTQNDNNRYCTCASCAAIDREEGSHAGSLIRFVNAIADDIAQDYPDVKILTLAYMYSVEAPKTPPRDNVIIQLCSYEFCIAHPYGECNDNIDFFKQLESWNEMTDNLYIWDYVVDFNEDYKNIPFMNFNSLYENYKTYREHDVIGVFNEGYGGNYSGDFNELRNYLISELMWNTDLPREEYDRAIYEFIDAYYGAASDTVYEYFTYLTEISGESHFELYASPEAVIDEGIFKITMQEIANWFNLASKLEADEPEVIKTHLNRLREGFMFIYRHFN